MKNKNTKKKGWETRRNPIAKAIRTAAFRPRTTPRNGKLYNRKNNRFPAIVLAA